MAINKYVVEGFEFPKENEAKVAKSELRGIDYIVSQTDMNNPKSVLILYNKIIDKKLFKTPIGINFLKEIQEMLTANSDIDNDLIKPIPVGEDISHVKLKSTDKFNYKKIMINSIVINIILIIVIILMYIIVSNSKNVNIINYENRIKEQYSVQESE